MTSSKKEFKVGDKVKIKNGTWTYAEIPLKIMYIYKNGDITLINPETEEFIERYKAEDLEKGWK